MCVWNSVNESEFSFNPSSPSTKCGPNDNNNNGVPLCWILLLVSTKHKQLQLCEMIDFGDRFEKVPPTIVSGKTAPTMLFIKSRVDPSRLSINQGNKVTDGTGRTSYELEVENTHILGSTSFSNQNGKTPFVVVPPTLLLRVDSTTITRRLFGNKDSPAKLLIFFVATKLKNTRFSSSRRACSNFI